MPRDNSRADEPVIGAGEQRVVRRCADGIDMDRDQEHPRNKKGKKVRVDFRRNRARPARAKDWTRRAREGEDHDVDTTSSESIVPKGDLSRRRTVIVTERGDNDSIGTLRQGIVVAMRGLYAEVDDGKKIWNCTIRRVLRTRLIDERSSVTIGDHVRFRVPAIPDQPGEEGVIENVDTRRGQLLRRAGSRIQTIVANVDQVLIISSADFPPPKPNLIDRYIVAAASGGIAPVVVMNKIDLDGNGDARNTLLRYTTIGYRTLAASASTGAGIEELRDILRGKASAVAGQSGVGKSSLLNAVQPGLALKTGDVTRDSKKGRHTTTTATLIRLDFGGYVVDTPGIRSFDLAVVRPQELEAHFVEFLPYVPNCKFTDCLHTHESGCAIRQAVEQGLIHPQRYESYVRLFTNPDEDR